MRSKICGLVSSFQDTSLIKRKNTGYHLIPCVFWWARQDLKASDDACPRKSIHQNRPSYAKNRSLMDLTAQNFIRNNNTALSPVLPAILTNRTRNRTVFELAIVAKTDKLSNHLRRFLAGKGGTWQSMFSVVNNNEASYSIVLTHKPYCTCPFLNKILSCHLTVKASVYFLQQNRYRCKSSFLF